MAQSSIPEERVFGYAKYMDHHFCAEDDDINERLDRVLAARLHELSRNQIQQLIKDGKVLVNRKPTKPAYRLEPSDCVHIEIPPPEAIVVLPETIDLDILFEDEHIAVINKSAGMVVHPGHGNENGTLVNAALARWSKIAEVGSAPERAGIVHRLDKDVSGIIVVALTPDAYDGLVMQFHDRLIDKHYLALVERHPPNDKGRVEAPIGRDVRHRKRMAVQHDGKDAITEFHVREFYGERALLDIHPITGRTHQIRVHLAFIGCPIVGDRVYGFRKQHLKLKRVFLHAHRLSFAHPITDDTLHFESPLPSGLQNILEKLPR